MRRVRKHGAILMIAIIIALLTAACGNTSSVEDVTDLQQYRTEYVGDSTNVANIVSHQDYPNGYSYEYIEIQSETEPYGLTVCLNIDPNASEIGEQFHTNADTAFDLIGNLGTLEYVDADSKEVIASYEASK